VVYDYDKLTVRPMEIARDLPGGEWRRVRKAEGYRWIMVGGEVAIENDRQTGAHPGRLLRHGAAQ
jgi:N-acyl-D-amino-acid deacylase